MTAVRVIIIKGPTTEDSVTVGTVAITPGMLLELETTGDVVPHNTAEANHLRMFAKNRDFISEEITKEIPIADSAMAVFAQSGAVINCILADGETIVIGDELASNGDGTLRKHVPLVIPDPADTTAPAIPVTVNPIVGVATEAVTTSGATARIAVRIV